MYFSEPRSLQHPCLSPQPTSTTAMATLWVISLFGAANRFATIREVILIVVLCLFSFRHETPVSTASLPWAVISIGLTIFAGSTYIVFRRSESPGANPPEQDRLRLEPVFFRCRTNHTRLFPRRHSFVYSVLEMGIPLSFKGSIGRLFSFNNGSNCDGNKWTIFGVDSRDYLKRGNETLEDKMGAFLKENV